MSSLVGSYLSSTCSWSRVSTGARRATESTPLQTVLSSRMCTPEEPTISAKGKSTRNRAASRRLNEVGKQIVKSADRPLWLMHVTVSTQCRLPALSGSTEQARPCSDPSTESRTRLRSLMLKMLEAMSRTQPIQAEAFDPQPVLELKGLLHRHCDRNQDKDIKLTKGRRLKLMAQALTSRCRRPRGEMS